MLSEIRPSLGIIGYSPSTCNPAVKVPISTDPIGSQVCQEVRIDLLSPKNAAADIWNDVPDPERTSKPSIRAFDPRRVPVVGRGALHVIPHTRKQAAVLVNKVNPTKSQQHALIS